MAVVDPAGDPASQARARRHGVHVGSAKFLGATLFALVAAFNLTAIGASLSPLLGLLTLLVTLLVAVAVLDRLGQRWAPTAGQAFDSWCGAVVRHLRAR